MYNRRVSALADALAAVSRRVPEAFRLLRTWVETNSHTGVPENVNAMGELLKQAFALPELVSSVQVGRDFGDHLAWHTPEAASAPRVVLVGHHDTVFPPGSFEGWHEDGDLIRGPGVLDMKGGIAVVWCALGALSDVGLLARTRLVLLSVGDEEVGSPDSRPFTARWARGAEAGLVFEAGRPTDAIITRRKGTGAVTVRVTGRASHAGNAHQDGVSAIRALARFVDAVERLTDYSRGITVNVGTFTGGTSKNTVPEHAECELDFRMVHADDGPRVMAALEAEARALEAETGARFELTGGVRRPPLERSEGSLRLYERYAEHARAAGLGAEESPLLGGGSDANDIGSLGVAVIDGLGPRGRGFHTRDEHIVAASLEPRAAALTRLLLDFIP